MSNELEQGRVHRRYLIDRLRGEKHRRQNAEAERDAALARLATIEEYCRHVDTESNEAQQGWLVDQIQFTLAQSPASALAKVKADSWDEGCQVGNANWPAFVVKALNPYRTEAS